jgi:MFS family permease
MPRRTRWGLILVLIGAGMIASFQIGKAVVAVPVLQRELSLSLAVASWIVGVFGTLGALLGLPAGILASIINARRGLIAGLLTIGLASIAGALATSAGPLLATRFLEGCGFMAIALSAPRLMSQLTAPRDGQTVFSLWGTYMPAGSAAMMLAAPPILTAFGWHTLWLLNGALALAYAPAVAVLLRHERESAESVAAARSGLIVNVGAVLRRPPPLLMAAMFSLYTFQYFAVTGLMPALLTDRLGLTIGAAGLITALMVLANLAGNLCAGFVLRRGVSLSAIAIFGFAFVALASFGIFSNAVSAAVVATLACASLALTGMIPASVFATLPSSVGSSAQLAIALGLIMQASNLGQLIGPTALGAFVERFGWENAPALLAGAMAVGIGLSLAQRNALARAGSTSP